MSQNNSPRELWAPNGVVVLLNGLLLNAEVDWLKDGALKASKAAVVEAPNAGELDTPNVGVLEENIGLLEALNAQPDPNTGTLDPPIAIPVLSNAGVAVEPKARVLAAPNAGVLVAPDAGVDEAPNAGMHKAPNAGA